MSRSRLVPLAALAAAAALLVPSLTTAAPGVVDPTVPASRDAEAVVLTGAQFGLDGDWVAPQNITFRQPEADLTECQVRVDPSKLGNPTEGGAGSLGQTVQQGCPEGYDEHSHYAKPDVDTADATGESIKGTPVEALRGYRWDTRHKRFVQIPFQVDEVFTRYLNNTASGFSIYSGEDQHTTYAYDREGFRFTQSDPNSANPCLARMKAGDHAAVDPVKGLDTNDEMAFMASDAGAAAPAGTPLPKGIEGLKTISLQDPTNPSAPPRYVYVMRAAADGPKPAYTAKNGYVHYQRDDNADWFAYSQSSYGDYGAAPKGYYCDADGNVVIDPKTGQPAIGQRRPRDGATITTDRYRYRYDGRWLMTSIQVAKKKGHGYGPDLVDRWKARAFAQDPNSNTPCCGYEEEDTNWGGSSILLGEKVGPVRAIRETWGADSGTNVIRRETFYRDQMIQKNWLRVHVIPPLDGIYAQWDFNAGRVNRFYNAQHTDGVPIDGRNDEVYGNFDDPCSERWDGDDSRSDLDNAYRQFYRQSGGCDAAKALAQLPQGDYYHQSMDPGDLTFGDTNAALGWSEVAGPNGTIVDRIQASPADATPGGAAQSVAAMPYYRDDACFDDGTGSDPGPELHPRHFDQEQASTASDGSPRRCWDSRKDAKVPSGDDHFWQGDIGTHGLHLLFLAESDNARLTVPVTEIVSQWQMVMLPGDPGNVGERYGRSFEKPLVPLVQ